VKKINTRLKAGKIVKEFQKEEEPSSTHRKGTFKINTRFEKALDAILRAPHESKPKKKNSTR
jgi:hypothetical protein